MELKFNPTLASGTVLTFPLQTHIDFISLTGITYSSFANKSLFAVERLLSGIKPKMICYIPLETAAIFVF